MFCRNCLADIKPSGDSWMHISGLVTCQPFAANAAPVQQCNGDLLDAIEIQVRLEFNKPCWMPKPVWMILEATK